MKQPSKMDGVLKALISNDEPARVKLQRGLWLKYKPETRDTPFSLKAIRKGVYPTDDEPVNRNFPSLTEQNIVLASLFWAIEELGREIGEVPRTLDSEVVEGKEGGFWYAVGWEWQEFKKVALFEVEKVGSSRSNYDE